jgi:hypothetical protein
VIIVNEILASRIRPDGQVIGRRILVKSQSGPAAAAPVERLIVGVIANTRSSGVDTRYRNEAYVPYAQNPVVALQIVAEAYAGREGEAANQMRTAVRALRPDLVVGSPRSMEAMIRQRMGATRSARQGMTLAVAGVGLGCAVAVGVTRYLTGWIYGVTPLDKATFAGGAAVMLLVAMCTVYFPVRKATSVDPVVALRAE